MPTNVLGGRAWRTIVVLGRGELKGGMSEEPEKQKGRATSQLCFLLYGLRFIRIRRAERIMFLGHMLVSFPTQARHAHSVKLKYLDFSYAFCTRYANRVAV